MLSEDRYFRDLTEAELWQRYCGFLDLSIDEFMDVQKELLMDEIERVADSTLGKKIMGNQKPASVEEFRRIVPLTTYDDYEPYLGEQQEDALGEKPFIWIHSAGRGGRFKWVPHGLEARDKIIRNFLGSFTLACTRKKGRVNISPGLRMFSLVPPPPYGSGSLFQVLSQSFSFQAIPPLETAGSAEFQERIRNGLQIALKDGLDVAVALGSILVKIGEVFSGQTRKMEFSPWMLHPKVLRRLLTAWLRSKVAKRAILPKDLWSLKGIVTGGVDTAIYKDDIVHYWGSEPYEFYVATEAGLLAMQTWSKKAMTFTPDSVFLEFIPYEQQLEHQNDKDYQPSTVLLDEVKEGKLYEVVITQFYGMPLLRYPLKDLIEVIALRDDETGIKLPQIAFKRRVGEVITLAGLAQLDEKTIWQAIANTGIKYTDWSACKEYEHNQSFLRIYLELREEKEAADLEKMIDEQLKIVDTDYKDIDSYLKLQAVRVTFLSPGTFERYMEEKRKEGADLAHMKPEHVNPHQATIQRLLQLSEVSSEK